MGCGHPDHRGGSHSSGHLTFSVIAADTHRKVSDEENRKYDRLEDERERAWSAAR